MRFLLSIAALLLAGWAVLTNVAPVEGPRRFDQIYSKIDAEGRTLANQQELLLLDASNPAAWSTYAEFLAGSGRTQEAHEAFQQAIKLGPGMSPVLMRAANFAFSHGYNAEGEALAGRILKQTDAFDEIVFSYLTRQPVKKVLGAVVPPHRHKVGAWLIWLDKHGTDDDLLDTWAWLMENRLCDEPAALSLTQSLWDRKSYSKAQTLWVDWLGSSRGDYPVRQLLANRNFRREPSAVPFDWTELASKSSYTITGHGPKEIRFGGTENVEFAGLRQYTVVSPGSYRFSAEVSSRGVTTDQCPYFHIFNPVGTGVVSRSVPLCGDRARGWIHADVQVPQGVQLLEVQMQRHASEKFDNKIAGTVQVYEVSLTPTH